MLRLTDGRGADVVLDTVGGPAFGRSLREAGHGGRVIALANVALQPSTVDTRDFYPKNVSILGFQLTNLQIHGYDPRPDLRELAERVAAGTYRVPVETVVPSKRPVRHTSCWNGGTTVARSSWRWQTSDPAAGVRAGDKMSCGCPAR